MQTYIQLMNSEPSMPANLERGAPLTPGVLGGTAFVHRLPHRVRKRFQASESRVPLALVIQHVARLHGVRVDEILSWCRQHHLVLARALIAWYSTEHCGTTLGDVATALRRDVSTLSRNISRYRRRHPKLFSSHFFAALCPSTDPPRRDRRVSVVVSRGGSLPASPCTDAQSDGKSNLSRSTFRE